MKQRNKSNNILGRLVGSGIWLFRSTSFHTIHINTFIESRGMASALSLVQRVTQESDVLLSYCGKSRRKSIRTLPDSASTLHIFTEGSKSATNVAFAFIAVNSTCILHQLCGRLPSHASIFSDSRSNIESLSQRGIQSRLAALNQQLATEVSQRLGRSFEWSSGHI